MSVFQKNIFDFLKIKMLGVFLLPSIIENSEGIICTFLDEVL